MNVEKSKEINKVVLHKRDGELITGFTDENSIKEQVRITTRKGKEQFFPLAELKAIFFVRDFKGDAGYHEFKLGERQPVSDMVWARLEFFDGEILEGRLKNDLSILRSDGLFLWPVDEQTNNEVVFATRDAINSFSILGV